MYIFNCKPGDMIISMYSGPWAALVLAVNLVKTRYTLFFVWDESCNSEVGKIVDRAPYTGTFHVWREGKEIY